MTAAWDRLRKALRDSDLLWTAAVCAVTLLAFLPVLRVGFFVWDDPQNIVDNPVIRHMDAATLKRILTGFFWGGTYAPVPLILWSIVHALFGMRAGAFHGVALVFHCAAAALLYRVTLRLLAAAQGDGGRLSPWDRAAAGLATMAYAAHPLRVEVLAWTVSGTYAMCGLACMASVYAYLRAAEAEGPGTAWAGRRGCLAWMAASIAAFSLALASYGLTATLPGALLILDVYPLGRLPGRDGWRSREALRVAVREKLPYLVLAAAAVAAAAYGRVAVGRLFPLAQFPVHSRLAQMFFGSVFYVEKTLLPTGLHVHYEFTRAQFFTPSLFNPLVMPALPRTIAFAVISLAVFLARRRFPAMAAAWLCYLVILLPASGISKHDLLATIAADRWSYLPAPAFSALAAAGLSLAWRSASREPLRRAIAGAAAAAVLVLAVLAWRQSARWIDLRDLFSVSPDSRKPLARLDVDMGRYADAVRHGLEADDLLGPGTDPDLGITLCRAYAAQGFLTEAAPYCARGRAWSQDIMSEQARLHHERGFELSRSGGFAAALSEARQAVALDGRDPSHWNNMGFFLEQAGDLEGAVRAYQEALSRAPGNGLARNNLANAQARLVRRPADKLGAAMAEFQKGLEASGQGRLDEAIARTRAAVSLEPGIPLAWFNLGVFLNQKGRLDEAIECTRAAVRLQPDLARAHFNLGVFLQVKGAAAEAVQHCSQAYRLDPTMAASPACLASSR